MLNILKILTYFASSKGLECNYPILASLFIRLVSNGDLEQMISRGNLWASEILYEEISIHPRPYWFHMLYNAISKGYADQTRFVLNMFESFSDSEIWRICRAIDYAIINNCASSVKVLLDINIWNLYKINKFAELAAKLHNIEILDMLIEKGANEWETYAYWAIYNSISRI